MLIEPWPSERNAATSTPADVDNLPSLIALLPMKAHSERVPGKNFRPLAGKPLFRWMLDMLLGVPQVARVVINTDAAPLLRGEGLPADTRVMVRERRPELRGDLVSMNRILADDVAAVPATTYLMTHATNPLLTAATASAALSAFAAAQARGEADSLFSVTRFAARFYDQHGQAVNHDPRALLRTQDLPPLLMENSVLYLFTPGSFAATAARIGRHPLLFPTPALESVDIDEEADWVLAEALLRSAASVAESHRS